MGNRRHLPTPPQTAAPDGQLLTDEQAQAIAREFQLWAGFAGEARPVRTYFHISGETGVVLEQGKPTTRNFVRVIAIMPTGPTVMYLSPEQAEEVSGLLTQYARAVRAGIDLVLDQG